MSVHFQRRNTAADNKRGYRCLFLNRPPDDLFCEMCYYIAREPQQLKCCGTLCCKSCLVTSWSKTHFFGSTEKCKNEPLDYFFDHKSNERIQNLKVKCTNSNQSCDWTGELKNLDDHRSQCPKEEIPCTFSEVGCETRLLRENLDDHMTQNQQQHLHCAMMSISRLRQELASTQKELRITQKELQTLPMILKMSNYSQFKETGDTWYSTPFYSRWSECRLRLRVRPSRAQGIHSRRQPKIPNVIVSHHHQSEEVSVALVLLSSPVPRRSLTVELLNQASDAAHHNILPCHCARSMA